MVFYFSLQRDYRQPRARSSGVLAPRELETIRNLEIGEHPQSCGCPKDDGDWGMIMFVGKAVTGRGPARLGLGDHDSRSSVGGTTVSEERRIASWAAPSAPTDVQSQ